MSYFAFIFLIAKYLKFHMYFTHTAHLLALATFQMLSSHMWLLLLSHFSRVRLCATPETAAHQAPPSLGFSRQEHWNVASGCHNKQHIPEPNKLLRVCISGIVEVSEVVEGQI